MTMDPNDGPGGVVGDVTDTAALLNDDLLLSGLASTGGISSTDPLGTLLAGFRADLVIEADTLNTAVVAVATAVGGVDNPMPSTAESGPSSRRGQQRANRRWKRRGAAGGLSVIIALGGVGAAAAAAHPGGFLYPLRRAVAGPRQDAASREIAKLLQQQHASPGASSKPLLRAVALLGQVSDPDLRTQLQKQLEAAQRSSPTSPGGNLPAQLPSTSGAPSPPSPGPESSSIPSATSPAGPQPPAPSLTLHPHTPPPSAVIGTLPPGQAKKSATAAPTESTATARPSSPAASATTSAPTSAAPSATSSPLPAASTSPSASAGLKSSKAPKLAK